MSHEILIIESKGLGASLQDLGLIGWRQFGVPPGGAMDPHAARLANRLLGNPDNAPVLELLLQGARLRMLRDAWIALAGAEAQDEKDSVLWRLHLARADGRIGFPRNRSGVWTYLAVEGGFESGCPENRSQIYPRGLLGRPLPDGQRLRGMARGRLRLPPGISTRWVSPKERYDYDHPPALKLWQGPQWNLFQPKDQKILFENSWFLTHQCNRVGYRLEGTPLHPPSQQMLSEPVRVGTLQIPSNGQPIVTMRDGPTVGGYPKIGMIDPEDLPRLAQCRPGQAVRFQPAGKL